MVDIICALLRWVPVLDHGRPSVSGSIRSVKMYSWAQCIVQRKIVLGKCTLCDPRGAGIWPLHPEHIPPPHLPEVPIGGSVISNLGPEWTGSYHTKEGFQVSEREWD